MSGNSLPANFLESSLRWRSFSIAPVRELVARLILLRKISVDIAGGRGYPGPEWFGLFTVMRLKCISQSIGNFRLFSKEIVPFSI